MNSDIRLNESIITCWDRVLRTDSYNKVATLQKEQGKLIYFDEKYFGCFQLL